MTRSVPPALHYSFRKQGRVAWKPNNVSTAGEVSDFYVEARSECKERSRSAGSFQLSREARLGS